MFAASLLLDLSLNPPFPAASVIDALAIYKDDDYYRTDPAESLAFYFLLLQKYGHLLALVFFGVSMILLGVIILMHGVFPRWLGGIIALAGFGYVLDSGLLLFRNGIQWRSYSTCHATCLGLRVWADGLAVVLLAVSS
jgi:membrane-bound ClpP family serine protease